MNQLDSIVRAALEEQVRTPPPLNAPADRVVALAAVVHRRRRLTAVAAGIVAVALAVGGFVAARGGPVVDGRPGPATRPVVTATDAGPRPVVTATDAGPRPDLLVGWDDVNGGWRSLLTAGGQTLSLAGITGTVTAAYRTSQGWLVEALTAAGTVSLWLLNGSAKPLIPAADRIAVAPDGRQLAWRSGDRLVVGVVNAGTLVPGRSSPAPASGGPIAYTGTTVVLGNTATGGGLDSFDAWVPGRGDYTPAWDKTTQVITVYQPARDGTLLGLVRDPGTAKSTCLARLDPADKFRATATACGLPLTVDPTGLVSPDGRWLAAPALVDGQPRVALLDLDRVFTDPAVTTIWPATTPLAWTDAGTVEVLDRSHEVMVARVGQSALAQIPVPGQPAGATVAAIPTLG